MANKIINSFELDTKNLKAGGETRSFTISGDDGAVFSLQITNEDTPKKYYNFTTTKFQTTQTRLDNQEIIKSSYTGEIVFPIVTDADHYDIFLFANEALGTKHADYVEVRKEDNSIDINASTGSGSNLIKKQILQTLDLTLTLTAVSVNSLTPFAGLSATAKTITTSVDGSTGKLNFSIPVTSGSTKAFKIDRNPVDSDIYSLVSRTIGSTAADIAGEDIFPAISDTDTVDGQVTSGVKVVMDNNVASNLVLGDKITTAVTTSTVDGAVTSGVRIVMDHNVASRMAVGDQVTTSSSKHFFNTNQVLVTHLDPDGDNAKEFQIDSIIISADIGGVLDGETLTFSSKLNRDLTTVAVLNPDTDNVKEFSMSQAIGLVDGATLSFSNKLNYRWPLDDIYSLENGMTVTGSNITNTTCVISDYIDTSTYTGEDGTTSITNFTIPGVDSVGSKVIITQNGTTNLITKTQTGNITLNDRQNLVLVGDTVKIGGRGTSAVRSLTGYEIALTNLKVTLTEVTTTTTGAVSASASVPVTSGDGIMDDVSTVSGIGINPGVVDPTVTTIGSYSGGGATLTLSAAQTLESGAILTFNGAGETITITGEIEIIKAGAADATIAFDLEKFITATDEAS